MKVPLQKITNIFKKKSSESQDEDMDVDQPVRVTPSPPTKKAVFRTFADRFADVFGKKEKKGRDETAATSDDKVRKPFCC